MSPRDLYTDTWLVAQQSSYLAQVAARFRACFGAPLRITGSCSISGFTVRTFFFTIKH